MAAGVEPQQRRFPDMHTHLLQLSGRVFDGLIDIAWGCGHEASFIFYIPALAITDKV
jgi:hypothetical protein